MLDDPAQAEHLQRQQLALLALQATRSPFAIAIACGFVAYTVRDHASWLLVGAWVIVLMSVLFVRRAYAQRVLRRTPAEPGRALACLVWFAFANGLVTGAAAPLFFPALHHEGRALLTMILVCWTAGGVSTHAAYARAFYAFVVPSLLPLATLWALTGSPEDIVLGVLVLLFVVIQIYFVLDNERVVQDSFLIRYRHDSLLDKLERERAEVMLARNRAEDANLEKSRFLAAASHDLRQPLHALSLFSTALGLRAPDGPIRDIAEQIEKALASLAALFDSLLDISRLDAGAVSPDMQPVSVPALFGTIEGEYRPVALDKGLAFEVEPPALDVHSDPVHARPPDPQSCGQRGEVPRRPAALPLRRSRWTARCAYRCATPVPAYRPKNGSASTTSSIRSAILTATAPWASAWDSPSPGSSPGCSD